LLSEEICRILLKKSEQNDEKFSEPLADVDQRLSVPLADVDQKFNVH